MRNDLREAVVSELKEAIRDLRAKYPSYIPDDAETIAESSLIIGGSDTSRSWAAAMEAEAEARKPIVWI